MQSVKNDAAGKGKMISVRVSKIDWDKISGEADMANLPLSEYVRRRVFGKKIQTTPNMAVLKELRRIAISLKELAPSNAAERGRLDIALDELRTVFEKLCK